MSRLLALLSVCLIASTSLPEAARAQSGSRDGGGFAEMELNRIRNRDLGGRNQYTISGIVNRAFTSALPRTNFSGFEASASRLTGLGGLERSRGSKPFTNIVRRPTVSPYQNLFREDLSDEVPNYNSLVRPQLRAQEFAERQNRQNAQVYQQLQSIAAGSGLNATGSRQIMPTGGHGTTFGNTGGYYPRRRRR